MADYHMLSDTVYGVTGSGLIEESSNMVNAVSFSHAGSINAAAPGMMSQSMPVAPAQNSSTMMPNMVPMQQTQPAQPGSQLPSGNMAPYQGTMHGYPQNEVPQKLHQYAGYGSHLQVGSVGGQYMTGGGSRLHHLGDSMIASGSQQQQQQQTPRSLVPNQILYQNRNLTSSHYGQQMTHTNTSSSQMNQSQYPNQYASVPHHQLPQHSIQQTNQSADMWSNSMSHPQMTRPCIPQTQNYTHQNMPTQHGTNSLTHSPLTMPAQRPSTPNQSQYVSNQEYPVQHPPSQAAQMQRSPMYNMNSPNVNQNGTHLGQGTGTPQSGMSQSFNSSLSQNEQGINFPQGPYGVSSQAASSRQHYNTSSSAGTTMTHSPQQHLMNQQPMVGIRPSMHPMGYSAVSPRVSSGQQQPQQHGGPLPPGSPARLQQQYHPPFSPNQVYSAATQPSPRPVAGDTTTPPHIPLYTNSQSLTQSPTSPQYRNQFPSQVTQSPRHLATTPPAEVAIPPSSHTPDRALHSSSTPQSQGSFSSPNATLMTSPGQGQSPVNSSAPSNSLQHLEQMVLPHMNSGPSATPTVANVSPGAPTAMITHNTAVGGNYYGHHTPLHPQPQQQLHSHLASATDTRPQPQSPAFSHVSAQSPAPPPAVAAPPPPPHTYLGQPVPAATQQLSPSVSSVPNSQPVQPVAPSVNNVAKQNSAFEDRNLLETNHHSSLVTYTSLGNSGGQVIMGPEPSIPQSNISGTDMPVPNSASSNQIAPVSNVGPVATPVATHPYSGGQSQYPKPVSLSAINYEMQQIQQELQQLHNIQQTSESQEKIKNLQERLRYLQMQKNSVSANTMPSSVNSVGIPSYPRPPMMYGAGNPAAYVHQQPMQPHTVHYNPQVQQPPVQQDMSMPGHNSQTMPVITEQNTITTTTVCIPTEKESTEITPVSSGNFSPPVSETPSVMPVMEKIDVAPDPYELTFNDEEPPVKMKRKTPKGEPKPPKEKKPPKPKKTKKVKNKEESTANNMTSMMEKSNESVDPGMPPTLVPATEIPSSDIANSTEVVEKKPKKSKKRKAKEKENDEPSSETKEPKVKKPRKKSPKQSKQVKKGKEPVSENNEDNQNLGENEAPAESNEVTSATKDENKENDETAESKDGEGKKEVKEKKEGKSKSSKTSKESKKSTPKKKLPKIALKFSSKKKKKKTLNTSDNSDLDKTPPPSPEDGEGIQKRRSARNTQRKKYTDDIELHLTDDETIEMDFSQNAIVNSEGKVVQVVMDNHNEDYMVVEKILAIRTVKKQIDTNAGSDVENSNPICESEDVEEYFVKYKNLSYIHCEWKTLEELEKGDRRFIQKVKRFKQKKDTFNFFDFLEEEPFNPDYTEVDRVLDMNEVEEEIFNCNDTSANTEVVNSDLNEKLLPPDQDQQLKFTEASVNSEKEVSEMKSEIDSDSIKNEERIEFEDVKPSISFENIPTEFIANDNVKEQEHSHFETVTDNSTDDFKSSEADSKSTVQEDCIKSQEDIHDKVSVVNENSESKPDVDLKEEESSNLLNKEDLQEPVGKEKRNVKITRHYLVKWRALTYEESTWELEDDVDIYKIEQFQRFREPPPKEKWKTKKRPKPSEWSKLEESSIYKGGNTLREYQLEGVNWLTFCWYNAQNCILADEMGLGKTIQSITFLNEIDKYGIPGPFLIIAPLSTIGNWQREFETWTDLNTITYHGSTPSRNMILEYEMYWKNEKGERIQEVYKFQVMITTFEIILTDCVELRAIPWRCVIIDEAHRLKNRNCKLLEGLRMLNTEHRVLLTGTPLQNNVEELFSLLNFLEPNRFACTEAFLEEFGDLKTEAQVDKLKALLKPMMLRRLKEDVEKSLAPKEETVIEVELTNIQKKYYRAILERNFTFLTKGNCYSNMPNLMNTMMELRKCCIHPFLINGAEEQIINDFRTQHEDCVDINLNAMVQASGKLVLIDKLLPRLRADGHRVLVFSQMVRCLDILEDYMVQKRYPYERIDGRVRGNLRQAAIDRFCKPDSDRFVFLLCTRAGGLGINLTAADTVIIFDSDWNPQNDLQAQARCHRIGQSKAVKVYRLICRNTYEREMFDKASLKLGLDKAVLQSMCPSKENIGVNQQMSKKEIEDLLRKGAYGALMEDDNAGDKFCEEDIDQILQRRTQVIQLESGTKGSTFSKATFASASTRSDIEIDDPNFWEKWAKKANLDVDELKNRNELIIQEPRRRTQTRRFGTDDHMLDLSDLETSDEDDDSVSTRTRASKRCSKSSRPKSKNRGRALDRERDDEYMEEIAPGNWTRAECFKVEKGLLTFGWGRWDECIALGQFRRRLTHKDCEHISRTILLYCLLHYKGDEKIKSFIWDLICPTYDGEQPIHRNHSESEITIIKEGVFEGLSTDGLSAPVPRGRKGKKFKKESKPVNIVIEESEWAKEERYNPDILLNDEAYRKHLNRHANKVLLRVRLLYYLKHEIIGDLHDQVFAGIPANEIPLEVPPADGDPPAPWWDIEVDRSLLLGIYKHGFERYNLMRQDPTLCFLARCGPPDGAALLAELNVNEDDLEDQASQREIVDKEDCKFNDDKEVDDLEPLSPGEIDPSRNNHYNSQIIVHSTTEQTNLAEMGPPVFPTVTDVNTRVRRLITAFQRNNKKLEIRNAQKARKIERREKFEAAIRERELKKRELQQRKWSRREEADFYRTISSFGIEYTEDKKNYNWSRFRNLARLERKYDETLAEYYKSFYAMCKRVCGKKMTEEEERASRCLQRVDLLHKIREEILIHPELDERLKLCQPSMDLPDWWICGKHDKDLLIGAAKHGLSRMDYHLLHDPNLSFKDVLKNHPSAKPVQNNSHMSSPAGCCSPVSVHHSTQVTPVKDELGALDSDKKEEPLSSSENLNVQLKDNNNTDLNVTVEHETEKYTPEIFVKDIEPTEDCKNIIDLKDEKGVPKLEEQENPKAETADLMKKNLQNNLKTQSVEKTEDVTTKVDDDYETKTEEADDNRMDTDRDEETDIEIDLKKDDDFQKDGLETSQSEQNTTINSAIDETNEFKNTEPLILELKEGKSDQKYDCETDTESKVNYDTDREVKCKEEKVDDSDSFKQDILSDSDKTLLAIKHEMKFERNIKETIQKELMKDIIYGHVEDSQGCISQNDDVMSQASFNLETELGEPTVAQLIALTTGNSVRWPKDKVLQIRLEHIVQAVEKNEWPVIRHTFLPTFPTVGTVVSSTASMANTLPPLPTPSPSSHRASPVPSISSQGHSGEVTPQATPEHTPLREPAIPDIQASVAEFNIHNKSPITTPAPVTSDPVKHRRRRRRRRFEVEAERVKLRQLLSHNMQQQQQHHQQQLQHVQQFLASSNASLFRNKVWDERLEDKGQIPSSPLPAALSLPTVLPTSTPSIPPPAHQNSSPRLSTTLGSLDLRVKSSIPTPMSFSIPSSVTKLKTSPSEDVSKTIVGSPSSPIDLSASSAGGSSSALSSTGQPNSSNQSSVNGSSIKSQIKNKPREGRSTRGGSRIDALALNLQARKQQQLMQEQHHPPSEITPSLTERNLSERSKDVEESVHHPLHHHHSHHQEKRNMEEEEAKLRRKRLQFSEEAARKSLNRPFDITSAPPAHSSFLSSTVPTSVANTGRLHLGSKSEDHPTGTNSVLDPSSLMHHDFKKWLDDHPELVATNPNLVAAAAAAMAFSPMPSFPAHTELLELPEGRRRGRRPRLDPSKIDFDKVTGEENVSVINRLTGKKITGSKAPPLKHLTEWLDKNPMFDVDPKWGPLVREKGNLPNNMLKRIVTPSEKRGRRTAASLLASAHQNLTTPPSTMSFPSASSLNPLSFANTGMLAGLPNMKFFTDPPKASSSLTTTTSSTATSASSTPIFLPFGGLAGMGLTNPLFGFPGFNFPGLQGTSPLSTSTITGTKDLAKDIEKNKNEKGPESNNTATRKNIPLSSSSVSASSIISSTTMPSATSLPFLYPAPGLLYNPLGLGGFTLPPNLPANFASFSQSSLMNGLGLNNPLITTSTMNTTSSSLVSSTLTSSIPSTSLATLPSSFVSKGIDISPSNKQSPSHNSGAEPQDTDDESLKSLMGNHDDDEDDDLDDGKLETYDNLDKDDSDKDTFRDFSAKSPVLKTDRTSAKMSESESESASLEKSSFRPSVKLESTKSKGVSDDPTSDSTDTESKHS